MSCQWHCTKNLRYLNYQLRRLLLRLHRTRLQPRVQDECMMMSAYPVKSNSSHHLNNVSKLYVTPCMEAKTAAVPLNSPLCVASVHVTDERQNKWARSYCMESENPRLKCVPRLQPVQLKKGVQRPVLKLILVMFPFLKGHFNGISLGGCCSNLSTPKSYMQPTQPTLMQLYHSASQYRIDIHCHLFL